MSARAVHAASLAAIVVAFLLSVGLRASYIGTLSDGHHQWLTAHSALIVDNWVADGILNDHLLGITVPRSIDAAELTERVRYVSYPLGALVPIFALAKTFPHTSTITLMHLWGLANQLCIAILLYLTITSFRFAVPRAHVSAFAAIAAVAYVYLPAPYYWHALVYFADQAVILPFVLALYLEARLRSSPSRACTFAQSAVLAVAAATDYLAVPLAAALFVGRLAAPLPGAGSTFAVRVRKGTVQLLLPVALILSFHVLLLLSQGLLAPLVGQFFFRTGIRAGGLKAPGPAGSSAVLYFFREHLHLYRPLYLIDVAALIYACRRDRSARTVVPLVGFVAATLQVLLLSQHSWIHDFSALKFFPLLAMTSFGLLPLLWSERARSPNRWAAAGLVASVALLCVVIVVHDRRHPEFPSRGVTNEDVARYIRQTSHYEDVYIGLDQFEIPVFPPHRLALSRKLVHRMGSPAEIEQFVRGLPTQVRIHAVLSRSNPCSRSFEGAEVAVGDWNIAHVDRTDLSLVEGCLTTWRHAPQ